MTPGARRPRARGRVVVFLAQLLARAFFRSVEVVGAPPPGGRVILAASHLNGFVDPVLLVAELGQLPRFLAKATLWSVAPARILLNLAGAVPVQRRVVAGDATDNRATFAAAVKAGRPLCRPGSPLKAHAAWHVFSAAAVWLRTRPAAPSGVRPLGRSWPPS